jgi:hypothetical protein
MALTARFADQYTVTWNSRKKAERSPETWNEIACGLFCRDGDL